MRISVPGIFELELQYLIKDHYLTPMEECYL